jgi:hypothetical protein
MTSNTKEMKGFMLVKVKFYCKVDGQWREGKKKFFFQFLAIFSPLETLQAHY